MIACAAARGREHVGGDGDDELGPQAQLLWRMMKNSVPSVSPSMYSMALHTRPAVTPRVTP